MGNKTIKQAREGKERKIGSILEGIKEVTKERDGLKANFARAAEKSYVSRKGERDLFKRR